MFTVHPQVQVKPEIKHSLPPLSQIMSNVVPYHQPQSLPQHANPLIPFYQHGPTSSPQLASLSTKQEYKLNVSAPISSSTSSTTPTATSPSQYNKCSCKQEGTHIPRPRNAFILFRQQHHQSVLDEGDSVKTNPDVSRELGKRWRDLSPNEKEYWNKLAEEEKKRHAEKYPGYRYIPRRFGKKNKCPTCKSRAHMKDADAHEQRLRILDLQEEEIKARLNTYPTPSQTSPIQQAPVASQLTPITNSPTAPDSDKGYNGVSSEEHAIAQSFLSLRNQPQHYYPAQQYYHQSQQPSYYTSAQSQPQQPTQPQRTLPQLHHQYYPQNVQQSSTKHDGRRVSESSQDDKHKAGSIASFLN